MDEKKMLEVDIESLENAYDKMQEVLDNLKDVDDFSNTKYQELHSIAEDINDLKIEKEIELERMEEIS